ncbi:hypothetical protein [Pseudomonas putida]|uniref:Uncharacterized protein n=1 Tax=Pseudomonas putida TaxID=303 RepID=A0A8I1EC59_PSEPU|nr:hypothetical protein [Pseudomonas putida]MBI6882589.1 hypothetical protein [Pseudomonas putida]
MKYFKIHSDLARNLGFNSIKEMASSGYDMDLCWGNGFDKKTLQSLLSGMVEKHLDDVDANNLLCFMCMTKEGARLTVDQCRVFGGTRQIANALIKGMDSLTNSSREYVEVDPVVEHLVDTLRKILAIENVPFALLEKPKYMTHKGLWSVLESTCRSPQEFINGLDVGDFCAPRYYLNDRFGAIVSSEAMQKWTYPGFVWNQMEGKDILKLHEFIASQIGEKLAIRKTIRSQSGSETVAPFTKALSQRYTFDQLVEILEISDVGDFFTIPSSTNSNRHYTDLLALTVTSKDISKLPNLSVSTKRELIQRGAFSEKLAVKISGSNQRLKGLALAGSLGL